MDTAALHVLRRAAHVGGFPHWMTDVITWVGGVTGCAPITNTAAGVHDE